MKKKITILMAVAAMFAGSGGVAYGQISPSGTTPPPYIPYYNGGGVLNNVTTDNVYIIGGRAAYWYEASWPSPHCSHVYGTDYRSTWSAVTSSTYYQWINSTSVTVTLRGTPAGVPGYYDQYNRIMFGNMSLATIQQNISHPPHAVSGGGHSCTGWTLGSCDGYNTMYNTTYDTPTPLSVTNRPATVIITSGARVQLTNGGSSIDRNNAAPAIYAYTNTGANGAALTHTGTTTITFPGSTSAPAPYTLRMAGTFQAGQAGVITLNGSAGFLGDADTLGVNGDYNHALAWQTIDGRTATFQIGEGTNNTNKFTIKSNGTLMNYGANNVNISTGTRLPVFQITSGDPTCNSVTNALKILNTQMDINYNAIVAPQVSWGSTGPLWMNAVYGSVNYYLGATFTVNANNNYIQVNAGTDITTSGAAFNYTGGTSNYQFIAGRNITFSANSPVTVVTNDDCGEDLMYAGQDITANSTVSMTKNQAGQNRWQAGRDVTVADGRSYTFNQNGATGDVYVNAGRNITMGGVVTVTRAAAALNGHIKWQAGNNIRTKDYVTFNNELAQDSTVWRAGRNIMTDKAVTFNHKGPGATYWRAGLDIFTHDGLYFNNLPSASGTTLINAGRHIIMDDTVSVNHTTTTGNWFTMRADAGNVIAQNKFHVDFQNQNTVTVTAPNRAGASTVVFPSNTSHRITVPYSNNPQLGNIYFRDSLNINRLSSGTPATTNILAGNNIITAMVTYKSNNATNGDNTNIISDMGDIFLGYNIVTTGTVFPASRTDSVVGSGSPASSTPLSYDLNRFVYNIPNAVPNGRLYIHAGSLDSVNLGWTGAEDAAAVQTNGGNIYFTHFCDTLADGSNYNTEVSIAGTNWYRCGSTWSSPLLHNRAGAGMWNYENSGIIGGVARCAMDSSPVVCDTLGLLYSGSKGNLRFDAGTRGNIIINNGAKVTFKDGTGNAIFRTRNGDIDMRYPFDVDSMQGGMLFLAQVNNLGDLQNPNYMSYCGCNEETNNVYLQDFQYTAGENSGSVYVGADNNIKLNYGGLQNVGTKYDPFLSTDYTVDSEGNPLKIGAGYPCGDDYHCDTHDSVNLARDLILNFYQDTTGMDIKKGGFAAVASDYIDVYKNMIYTGGKGSGMAAAPETGTLHGEGVAGYGLYMKTQGNKSNWNVNAFNKIPTCPTGCGNDDCNGAFLHMVSRMTFHADARLYAMKQRVYLGSPVIEVFGDLVLDTDSLDKTGSIVLQTDSLIMHDSLIVVGKGLKYRSWSGLKNDKPIFKFGYNRETPPQNEWKLTGPNAILCEPCHEYIRFSDDPLHMLDTIVIKFQDDAFLDRLNSTVFDHTVLTFLTDSFDHKLGNPVQNAKIYVDTLKIRNQVDLYADPDHTRDAHLELISEEQMHSKDYAGAYTRHLHMEPIGPCGKNYSELWTSDDLALDVITTSTFGGFGFIHSDVHVENDGDLNPGFTSLRLHGNCYEQRCGTQRMKDLRLDKGANIHISVGSTIGINNELSDIIDVDRITTYGTVDLHIEKRPCEHFDEGCYPIIYYKSQSDESINNLKITFDLPDKNSAEYKAYREDYERLQKAVLAFEDGVVYLCAGEEVYPTLNRAIQIPSVTGVTTNPPAGISYVISHSNFDFTAAYSTEKPLKVTTNRIFDGVQEELKGTKNANGEYEYTIRQVTQNIVLSIGPDFVANASIDGTAVWSHGEMIYIKVEREDIASIYSVAGQLIKRIDLPEGDTSIPMERGVYVVTLKDGSVHKVIVK